MSRLTDVELIDLHKRAEKLGLSTAGYAIHLEREREADRAAIRALLHEYEICLGHRTALREHSDHSEAIQRAQDAKG